MTEVASYRCIQQKAEYLPHVSKKNTSSLRLYIHKFSQPTLNEIESCNLKKKEEVA